MYDLNSAEVAQGISKDSCGLIFGMNTFLALVLQTLLTIIVSDERGLALDERSQFIVYGACFGVLGIAFLGISTYTFCKYGNSVNPQQRFQVKVNDVSP